MGGTRLIVALAMMLGTSGTAMAQGQTYRAGANATRSIDLSLCTDNVYVSVRGDGDTDLDFTITDNFGRQVHRDFDSTDITFVTLRPRITNGCVKYVLQVQNRGTVYNNFTVTTEDRGSRGNTQTTAKNRNVAIHNHTAETINSIYFSNTADGKWGPDRLGSNVMRSSTNRSFNIDDGTGACRFDIRAVTASGREYVKNNINVCAVSTVDFGTEVSH